MDTLTKQEKIIVALMRGLHLDSKELDIAKEQAHIINVHIKNRTL
jgi:hypothetical protein